MEGFLNHSGRQAVFLLRDLNDIIAARRAGTDLAHRLHFDENAATNVATIIVEAGTNIVKHAVHGEIILRSVVRGEAEGIEILAIDAGPGMNGLGVSVDHMNASDGAHGGGLHRICRAATEFDAYTALGKGTVLWMQVWTKADAASHPAWDIGVICLPIPSEEACGDAWDAVENLNGVSVIVADGLGHGPDAALASEAAIGVVRQNADIPPADTIRLAHQALKGTRGAAVAVAHVDKLFHQVKFAGIGNIAARLITEGVSRHMMSHNGIVGSNLRKVEQLAFPWAAGSTLIMQSDGIGSRWNLEDYPGLFGAHPALIAAVLYRDFLRPRDDVTVVVIRHGQLN